MIAETSTVQLLICGVSFFGAGVALYLAIGVNLREAVQRHDPWPVAYAVNRGCVALLILLIAETVARAPDLPLTWRLGLYTLALSGAVGSWVFIAIDNSRRNRRRDDREGNQDAE